MTDATDDEELVRKALDGLFEIASDDRPASVTSSLRDQILEMDPAHRRALVEQMVDTDRLEHLVREGPDAAPDKPQDHPGEEAEKVDRALEPLVRWRLGETGRRRLEGLGETERMHVLFSSLGPR